MRTATSAALAAALVLLAACGAPAPETSPAPAPAPAPGATAAAPADSASARPRFSRDMLTEQEILQANVTTNALDAVQRLRPQWLRIRGSATVPENDGTTAIQAWLNGRHLGDVQTLRDIPVGQIIDMRWVEPIQARQRYGPGNARGVIAVNGR